MIVLICAALFMFVIFAILFLVFALDILIRRHDLPTSGRATRALIKAIKQYKPDAKNFYDLGCGHGALCLAIKKALPGLEIYGADNSAIRIFFAKLKSKRINFRKQNIFDVDLSSADIVYTYLWYDLMPPLEKKLQNELKPGAIVITNTSNFPTWQPIQKIVMRETLFVYIKR